MINYLDYFHIIGPIAAIIVALVFMSEIVKAIKTIGEFIAANILKIQTKTAKKKAREEEDRMLTMKNNKDLQEFMKEQRKFNTDLSTNLEEFKEEVRSNIESVRSEVSGVTKSVDEFSSNLTTLSDTVSDMQLENMRETILDFESAISTPNGPIYGRDKYTYIRGVYSNYKNLLKTKNKNDDDVDLAMVNINKKYEYNALHHTFMEDIINRSDGIKEEIRDEITEKPKKKTTRKRTTKSDETDG